MLRSVIDNVHSVLCVLNPGAFAGHRNTFSTRPWTLDFEPPPQSQNPKISHPTLQSSNLPRHHRQQCFDSPTYIPSFDSCDCQQIFVPRPISTVIRAGEQYLNVTVSRPWTHPANSSRLTYANDLYALEERYKKKERGASYIVASCRS